MATYLLTWNPRKWEWLSLEQDVEKCRKRGFLNERWSCGVTKRIRPNDRVFLIKLGAEQPTGIMASGHALSDPFVDGHFNDARSKAHYIKLRYDVLLNPTDEEPLSRDKLQEKMPDVQWSPQASGITIPAREAQILEGMWKAHLESKGMVPSVAAEEVITPEQFWEGSVRTISVNAFERDPRARKACLDHHGYSCAICSFNFERRFGQLGRGFIHVHHLRPLAEIGEQYEVDPIKDLIPLCPNCHAMVHLQIPALTLKEVADAMR
jgi:5-methylcytosine-specific restriction protein A